MPLQVYEEACCIVAVIKNFIPEDKLAELLIKLDEDYGKKSLNQTTKEFLSALRNVVDKPLPPPPLWLWISFYTLVIVHIMLIFLVLTSFFVLPFYAPWYIATPVMVFIWFFSTTKVECHLTNLENHMRKNLGLKKIGGFIGHYLLKPIKIMLGKKRINTKLRLRH